MIQIKNLIKTYDKRTVVQIEEFSINKGEITGIVGKNGAGKTTLLRMMLDLIKPDTGMVYSNGIPVFQSEHWKQYTGSYIDSSFLIEFLKPTEYFDFVSSLHKMTKDTLRGKLEELNILMDISEIPKNRFIRDLSSGDKLKTGLMGALIPGPEVLILDEPFNYLDPTSQLTLKVLLRNLSIDKNAAIIISSHNLQMISDLCTRIALMENGRIIKSFINSIESMQEIEDYFLQQLKE